MADTPTAIPFTGQKTFGGAAPPSIHETDDGWQGEKWFWVNCDDCDRALTAIGLPARGAPWSAAMPELVCRERVSKHAGGTSQADTGLGGACVVQCVFRTIGGGGELPPPSVGGSFTYVVPQVGSLQLLYDVRYATDEYPAWTDPDASPIDPVYEQIRTPIAGGRGASVSVGATRLCVVVDYLPEALTALLPKMMWLQRWQSVNKEPVTLPPVIGALNRFTMQAGQAKYATFEVPQTPVNAGDGTRLLRVTHQLEIAPDFWFRWKEEDQYGQAFGPEIQSQVYYDDSFAGLW